MSEATKAPELFMVFDVESVGLHGEAFAVGYVVIDRHGNEQESGLYKTSPDHVRGTAADRKWIEANVVPALRSSLPCQFGGDPGLDNAAAVRSAFWDRFQLWKSKGSVLAADCPWPVEARFLIECIEENPSYRNWQGPYPLIDVASVRLAAGCDPLGTSNRDTWETPEHNPLADARQSARLLIEALDRAGKPI